MGRYISPLVDQGKPRAAGRFPRCTLDESSTTMILTRQSLSWMPAIIVVGSIVFESAAWSSGNLIE